MFLCTCTIDSSFDRTNPKSAPLLVSMDKWMLLRMIWQFLTNHINTYCLLYQRTRHVSQFRWKLIPSAFESLYMFLCTCTIDSSFDRTNPKSAPLLVSMDKWMLLRMIWQFLTNHINTYCLLYQRTRHVSQFRWKFIPDAFEGLHKYHVFHLLEKCF